MIIDFHEMKKSCAEVGVDVLRTNAADPGGEQFFAIRELDGVWCVLGPLTLDQMETLYQDALRKVESAKLTAEVLELRAARTKLHSTSVAR